VITVAYSGVPATLRGEDSVPLDLLRLVNDSDAIVLAERVSARHVPAIRNPWGRGSQATELVRYRVRKVYRGRLVPGETVEVYDHDWSTRALWPPEARALEWDPEAVLFLWCTFALTLPNQAPRGVEWTIPGQREGDGARFYFCHSGLRLLSAGHVYTFIGFGDAGRAVSVLSPADREAIVPVPLDDSGSPSSGAPRSARLTLEEFERDIREAILRVEALRYARTVSDAAKCRDLLLGLFGPYEKEAARRQVSGSPAAREDADDSFLKSIVAAFLESGDVTGALGAFARWPYHRVRLKTAAALEAASRRDLEPRLRVAAVRALDRHLFIDEEAIRSLAGLAKDRERAVRDVAIETLHRLRRDYPLNPDYHTRALDTLWEEVMAELAAEAPGPRRGGGDD
jgi:hypothetical protein